MAEYYQGSALRIKIGTKTIFHEVECKLDFKRDMKEIGSKDVTGTLVSPGKKSFTLTGKAIAKNSDGSTQEDINSLLTAYDAGTEIDITLADGVSGNIAITGKAYIESISVNSKDEEIVDYDFSFVGNGAATIGTTT